MTPLRPTRLQERAAVAAGDKTAQRKIDIQVFPGWNLGIFLQTRFDFAVGFVTDQRFMVTGSKPDIPIRRFDISGVDAARQYIGYLLIADFPFPISWEFRLRFQEPLYFDLQLKTPRGIAFERFLNYRSDRLIAHKNVSLTGYALVAIANGSLKDPIAVLNACAHPVFGLLAVFHPLMLRNACEKIFNQHGIGILSELNRRRLQNAARFADAPPPKLQMRIEAPRQPGNIIDDL